jgi:hypothetical protein
MKARIGFGTACVNLALCFVMLPGCGGAATGETADQEAVNAVFDEELTLQPSGLPRVPVRIAPLPVLVEALKRPNLTAAPRHTGHENRSLFEASGGFWGYAMYDSHGSYQTFTFVGIPNEFCGDIETNPQAVVKYYPPYDGAAANHRQFSMTVALGPIRYSARNGPDKASPGFAVELFQDGYAVDQHAVASLGVGQETNEFSYDPQRNVTVFRFPDDNYNLCFQLYHSNVPGAVIEPEEEPYKVKVDGGNHSSASVVLESNEGDNERDPLR